MQQTRDYQPKLANQRPMSQHASTKDALDALFSPPDDGVIVESAHRDFLSPPGPRRAADSAPAQLVDPTTFWKPAPQPLRKRVPAQRWLTIVNVVTLFTCLLFLYDGHQPGWSGLTYLSLLLYCALAVGWTAAGFNWLCNACKTKRDAMFGVAQIALAPMLVVACCVMVIGAVPAKIGLWASLDEFQSLMHDAPTERGGKRVDRKVGVYDVRRYAADGKGGVYFVTGEYRDALNRQNVSIGFAFNPSQKLTPFGKGNRLTHISGEWYCFAATDGGANDQ